MGAWKLARSLVLGTVPSKHFPRLHPYQNLPVKIENHLLFLAEIDDGGLLGDRASYESCTGSARKHLDFVIGFVAKQAFGGLRRL